ncbi:hypothetical protein KC320_g4788 [Hortaea werneckii]|nr:hypothetical protein KC320_g4788 [Hortaea werneckii]
MPPRIPFFNCLRASQNASAANATRSFSQTSAPTASTVTQRRRRHDPYALAQAKARKAANLSRQEVLKKERAAALGDPVNGVETPFVRSFDTALPPEPAAQNQRTQTRVATSPSEDAPGPQSERDEHLNFYLSKQELEQGLEHSRWLSTPPASAFKETTGVTDLLTPEEKQAQLAQQQTTANEALRRIASLSLGSSKDRLRVNIQRIIDTFGRHNTDSTLPPRPKDEDRTPYNLRTPSSPDQANQRVGLDTGSSEVQIAILTAKIRTLSSFLSDRGRMDKVNKRNLRLLVHRRQKLLRYLERKERGGPRFQNVVDVLGLTEGMWRGEISL